MPKVPYLCVVWYLHFCPATHKFPYLHVDWYLLTTVHFLLYYLWGGYGWKSRGRGIQAVGLRCSVQAEYIVVKTSRSVTGGPIRATIPCGLVLGSRQARNSFLVKLNERLQKWTTRASLYSKGLVTEQAALVFCISLHLQNTLTKVLSTHLRKPGTIFLPQNVPNSEVALYPYLHIQCRLSTNDFYGHGFTVALLN